MKAFLCFVAFCIAVPCAWAQVNGASLGGTVQDPTGSAVPGAPTQVLNTSTGVRSSTTTGADGNFIFPSLSPGGPYTVTVQAAGFKREERSGITLEVNQSARVNITLQIGDASETVQVSGDAPLLETSTATQGSVIENRAIVNLPLNQRNTYALVFLAPGVTGSVTAQYNSENISINGGRPGSSEILVDGIPSSPPLVNPIQGFAVFPSVDAVQEFKVQTNSYSAEFGRTGSGVINLIYKSGTNQYHGSLFEFIRNSDLDADSFFSNLRGVALPSFRRSQFGGSVGGPVDLPKLYHGHDKTFFFFAYEGLRQGSASSVTTTVPTLLQRQGNFSQTLNAAGQQVVIYDPSTTVASGSGYIRQPFPGNIIPTNRINPVAANILNYYPLPNQPGVANTGANNFFSSGSAQLNTDQIDAKVDENLNESNRFFVRYSRRNLNQPFTALFPQAQVVAEGGDSTPQISNSAAVDYTWTKSPTFLMEFRYGFARTLINFVPISEGFNPTTLGFPSYIAANADQLLFPGIAVQNYYTLGDAAQGDFRHGAFESHLLSANGTKVQGAHLVRFGAEGRRLRANDLESGNSTGNFTFTSALTQGPNPSAATSTAGNAFATLLLGVGSGNMLIDSKNAATESEYYGFYVQDDWKATRKLTLNIGLRYGFDMPRTERYDRMETFDPNVSSPLAGPSGLAGLKGGIRYVDLSGYGRRQYDPVLTNFDPRVGFAYQLDNSTVLRGGYGIFHGPSYRAAGATVGNIGFSSSTSYVGSPNGLTPTLTISNPFPNGFNPVSGSSQGLLSGVGTSFESPVTGDNSVPYTENYDFDIQRQLPGNLLVDVSYVGSHGLHLNKTGEADANLDQLTPQALALGSQLQQSVPNPFFGLITNGALAAATVPRSYLLAPFPQYLAVYGSFLTGGYTLYNSVQVKVEKRFSQGLNLLVAFTGQKLIDNYSIITNVGNGTGVQNIYNQAADKSVSSNDISKRLVISGNYNLPFGKGQMFGSQWNRFTDTVLGGWQVNGISTAQTGFPLVPTTQNTSGSGSVSLRPNNNGQSAALSGPISQRLGAYFNTSVFSQPAPFTFGNVSRTLPDVRSPGTQNIDLSLFKNFKIAERLSAQLRAEAFNLLNQVVFGSPNTVLSSGQFGVISGQSNSPRTIQFALKLLF